KVGDKLVTAKFQNSMTRGFAAIEEPNVAVCLLPGTEIAFEKEVKYERFFVLFPSMKFGKLGKKVAQFRQINLGKPCVHHDALEFPDGETVLLTRMCEGQHTTVLQLPASGRPVNAAEVQSAIRSSGKALRALGLEVGHASGSNSVGADDCAVCGGLWCNSLSKSLPAAVGARATPGDTHRGPDSRVRCDGCG